MIVWSYGGGTQSIAIGLLIIEGKLPRPDMIVMADTGMESTETWEYLDQVMRPLFDQHNLAFHIAPHDLANVDLYGKNGDLLIPAFTKTGKLPTYCSSEWKTYVCHRYLRSQGVKECDMWIGMSTDEIERLKPSRVKWITHQWPLCGMPREANYGVQMNRRECKQYVLNMGYPEPPKSCCFICPHRQNHQWARQKKLYPQDHQKAVEIDKLIRSQDTRGGVWLHKSHKPLDEIDFSEVDEPTLFNGCETGFCWT